MYARPELEAAHTEYWKEIRRQLQSRGIDSPASLSQQAEAFSVWKHPELVISQTCGMPYRLYLQDHVALVGTPDFGLEGCPPGYYRSVFVVREQDPRHDLGEFIDACFAYNQVHSQSGFAAPYWHLQKYGFWFKQLIETGGHLKSLLAVHQQQADITCLDAVTWRLMQQYEPAAKQLRALEWTQATPGLPYISAANADVPLMFSAIDTAISSLSEKYRSQLGITGLIKIDKADYLSIPDPPSSCLD